MCDWYLRLFAVQFSEDLFYKGRFSSMFSNGRWFENGDTGILQVAQSHHVCVDILPLAEFSFIFIAIFQPAAMRHATCWILHSLANEGTLRHRCPNFSVQGH